MPVEADRIADAARDDLHAGAVGVVAADLAVGAGIDLADVAVRADLHIHLSVRAERHVFPIVVDGVGQIIGLGQLHRLGELVEIVLDLVVAIDLVDREHVERAVLECEAVGLRQALDDSLGLALAVLVRDGIDAPDDPRAHEHGALVAHHHGAGARMAARPDLGLEACRQLDLVDRQLVDRRGDRRDRMTLEVEILLAPLDLGLVDRAEARPALRTSAVYLDWTEQVTAAPRAATPPRRETQSFRPQAIRAGPTLKFDMLASLMRKRLARFAARDGPASQRAGLSWRRVSDKWPPARKASMGVRDL